MTSKASLIKEIISVLDFGNRDQKKTVMNAVYNIYGNFREQKASLKQDIRTSNNIHENSSEAEILIQLNDIHSFDSSAGWDANGDYYLWMNSYLFHKDIDTCGKFPNWLHIRSITAGNIQ